LCWTIRFRERVEVMRVLHDATPLGLDFYGELTLPRVEATLGFGPQTASRLELLPTFI
jgi:hypothetical protein